MEEKRYLALNDIESYRIAFHLSNRVWETIIAWDSFTKDTVGKQFVRAVDSISANIAEGFGRYGKKDKIKFYQYAKGSLKESFDWNEKSKIRRLISQEKYQEWFIEFEKLPKAINSLIKYTNDHLTI